MPLNANALLTLPESKNYLKITSEATDSIIERMINSLSTEFETETGRKIKQQTLTDYRVDGDDAMQWDESTTSRDRTLYLPFAPVQSISKIEMRYSDESITVTITDSSKWKLNTKKGRVELLEQPFIAGSQNILITMVVGYPATDDLFSAFQKHFLDQLIWDYEEWDKKITGVSSRSLQDGSVQYLPRHRFIPKVQEFLDKRRDDRVL